MPVAEVSEERSGFGVGGHFANRPIADVPRCQFSRILTRCRPAPCQPFADKPSINQACLKACASERSKGGRIIPYPRGRIQNRLRHLHLTGRAFTDSVTTAGAVVFTPGENMLRKLSGLAAATFGAAVLVAVPQTASAADIITNGSFNTDLSGWTAEGGSRCSYTWSNTAQAGVTGGYAQSGASGPSTCGLYQTVTLPAGSSTLTVSLGTGTSGNGTSDRSSLQIRSSANAVLATLYSRTGDQAVDNVQTRGPYDLSAYAGQTVRVYFETVHDSGPYIQRIDNVVLDAGAAPAAIPTMSEWAMILLGVILVGGAALWIQRRRLSA